MRYPEYLLKLINILRKLPGVGSKTAERYAFHMLNWPEEKITDFAASLEHVKEKIHYCYECGALIEKEPCFYCHSDKRVQDILCVVAHVKDVFSIESTRKFNGLYHVLGGIFSPIEGKFPKTERIEKLKMRIAEKNIKEIIIALDATLEGDATALFLKKELNPFSLNLSRLALGIPMGSSLDFIDEGTLSRALIGRGNY
jgi:recombination protein RecR